MQKIAKTDIGAVCGCLRMTTVAAFLGAALLVAATPEPAQAQFYPWGSWGNPGGWKPKPRRARRVPRYVEPSDDKPATALPKPTGPLVLVVSIGKQTVTVYDDNKVIAKSPISSGTSSNPTPTGIFSILEKNRTHYSNLYGGAPMPFMQRVTNSGVAMHAGDLPGYPASHGCIRLPYSFARSLFGITDIGARVIISDDDLTPAEFNSPRLIAPLPPDSLANNGSGPVPAAATGTPGEMLSLTATENTQKRRTRASAAAARVIERQRLATNIVEAENAKRAAEDQAKAAADAVQAGREMIRKERTEEGRLADLARKAARDADAAAARFTALTAKMAKVDAAAIDAAEFEKQSGEEVAEETKLLDAMDAAVVAKRVAATQVTKSKQAVADAGALEKARKVAVEDVKNADTVLASAKDTLVAADALEARKDSPVSIFISAKTGRLIAKLGFAQVLDVPVTIAEPGRPLGTHVLTATTFTEGEKALRWNSVSLRPSEGTQYSRRKKRRHDDETPVAAAGHDADAASALERIEIPKETAELLAELMKPGSSFIISDYGLSRETSARTEFVVEPWRSRPDSSESRYY
ncbi:MAG: L,D-transpeptidase family protein [Hyphomicrobium sp.]|nr:L,D-transpeptidase family protein [Hyphomicrobium sp.]